jgi:hypothetical protein
MPTLNKLLGWVPQYKVATTDSAGNAATFTACTLTITNSANATVYGPAAGTAAADAGGYHIVNWPASTLAAGTYTATFTPTINGTAQVAEVFALVLTVYNSAPNTVYAFVDDESGGILNPTAPVHIFGGQTDKAIRWQTASLDHTGGTASVSFSPRLREGSVLPTIQMPTTLVGSLTKPATFHAAFPAGWSLTDLPAGEWLVRVISTGGPGGSASTSSIFLIVRP